MAALLILVALGTALLLWQQPWQSEQKTAPAPIPAGAAATLTVQFADLSAATTQQEFARAAGAGSAAASFAANTWQARADLGAEQVRFRYVSGGASAEFSNGDTRARVEIAWSDASDTTSTGTIQVRMRPREDGTFDIVSAGFGAGQLPVWLAGSVAVERTDGVTVVLVDDGDVDLAVADLAREARRQVASVVPASATSSLVVISTPSPDIAAAVLGQPTDSVQQIAAVSTAFDGRNGDLTGPVVVLNPEIFDAMDERAAQVVMSHEAAHVLTGAVASTADTWVTEGFADFVALHDDTAPLSVSAGQILAQVRIGDVPAALPTAEEFNSSAYGLGAVYESAWMVFRMLGEQFDDATIIEFYRSVLAGASVDDAAQTAFGFGTSDLTDQWQDYLMNSASTVS